VPGGQIRRRRHFPEGSLGALQELFVFGVETSIGMDGLIDGRHPSTVGSREFHNTVFNSGTCVACHLCVQSKESVCR
jgi:hypothetical protein